MIYLHSGGGDSAKQQRVNQAATDKAQQIAQISNLYSIPSPQRVIFRRRLKISALFY
ncbi:hypothetical protein ACMHUM_11945 [Proteus mirabilis]